MGSRTSRLQNLLGLFLLLFALASVLFYLWGDLYVTEMQADVVDTLQWARATVESGKLADPEFYYPYAIPFGGNLLLAPCVLLFGCSLTALRVGMTAFTLLLAGAYVAFFYAAVFRHRGNACGAAGCMLLLFLHNTKLREILYAHIIHYSLAILFTLLLCTFLSLCFHYKQKSRGATITCALLCCSTAFFCAAEGLPVPAMSLVPVLCAFVGERILRRWMGKSPRVLGRSQWLLLIVLLCAAVLGYGVYRWATLGVPTYYGDRYFQPSGLAGSLKNLTNLYHEWVDWLLRPALFADVAPANGELTQPGQTIFAVSKAFMHYGPGVLLVLTLWRYRRLKRRGERLLVLTFWALAAEMVILNAVMPISSQGWRLIPALGMFFVCWIVLGKNLWESARVPCRLAAMPVACLLLCLSLVSGVGVWGAKTDTSIWYGEGQPIALLREHNLSYGFCDQQAIGDCLEVLLGDGGRALPVTRDDGCMFPFLYENRVTDFDPPEGTERFFYIRTWGADKALPEGATLLYSGKTYRPSYNRRTDSLSQRYDLYVFEENPLEPYYLIRYSGLGRDKSGTLYTESQAMLLAHEKEEP